MNFGGMQRFFSGSVGRRKFGVGLQRCLPTIALPLAALFFVANLDVRGWGADGDPPLAVPTLQQGRALLTRDMLHQQCEQALVKKDWAQLNLLATQALSEERRAFGEDFEGSASTDRYQHLADIRRGQKSKQSVKFNQMVDGFTDSIRTDLKEISDDDLRSMLSNDYQEQRQLWTKRIERTAQLSADLTELMPKAIVSNDFSKTDPLIEEIYQLLTESEEVSFSDDLNQLLTDFEDDDISDYLNELATDEEKNESAFYRQQIRSNKATFSMLYSQAKQRSGDHDEALTLARQAFELANTDDPWDQDMRPIIGGRAIGEHFLSLLNTRLAVQRKGGDWNSASKTADEMLPIARKLWDHYYEVGLFAEEAKKLSEKPDKAQSDYAKTVREQVDFEAAMGERRFGDAIEIGVKIVDERTSILGPDCVEGARINRKLGYLYWTQSNYSDALERLADAALVFAKHLPHKDTWLKSAMSDLWINATLLAQSDSQSLDVAKRIETVIDSLSETLTERHFGVAEGRLCLLDVRRISAMSDEERKMHSALSAAAAKRNQLFSSGQFTEAAQVGKPLAEQARQLFGEPSPQHLEHLRCYANCLAMSGNADASLAVNRDLLDQYDMAPFNRTSDFHWNYNGMANALSTSGGRENNIAALEWLAKARSLTTESLGKQTNAYASHLEMEAQILRDNLNAPAKSLRKFQEANTIYEALYGNQDSFNYCQGLVNVGLCQNQLRLWEAADQHLKLALEIRERNDYQNPYMLAWNLWALGSNSFDQRKFPEAVSYLSRALAIKEKETPNATDISSVYGQILAAATLQDGRKNDAAQVLKQFLDRRGSVHQQNPERFADECRDAAQWLFDNPGELLTGKMTKERQAILDELALAGRRSYMDAGTTSDWRIIQLDYYRAGAAALLGDSERAYPAFQALLEQARSLEFPPHSLIGNILVSLSNLYKQEFAFDQTLHYRRLAKEAFESAFGKDSMHVADTLKGEADILLALGDYSLAEQLTQQAADIFSELGHPMQAEVYQQLAHIYQHRNDYDRAEQYLYAARAHLSESGSHRILDLGNRLAVSRLMLSKGEYSRALEIATQLVDSASDSPDAHIQLPARSARATALLGLGQAEAAIEALKDIIAETEQSPSIQLSAETRAAYAAACQHTGDQREASRQFRIIIDDLTKQHKTFGRVLSQRQKLELRSKLHQALSMYVSHVVEMDESLADCYETIMPLKGLVSAGQPRHYGVDVAASQETLDRSRQIDQINQELSSLLFGNTVSDPKQTVERIEQLTKQRESLEVKLSVANHNLGDKAIDIESTVSVDQLQQSLRKDEALIDFVSYMHHTKPGLPHSETEHRLLAFVIKNNSVHVVPLGQLDELKPKVAAWRKTLESGTDREFDAVNRSLASRVWDPVKEHVGEARVVLLSFDGLLSKVSFAAFPTDEGGYLVDDRTIVSVSSPRVLVQTRADKMATPPAAAGSESQKMLLLVGGVNYDSRSNKFKKLPPSPDLLVAGSTEVATPGTALRSASSVTSWSYLPGTKEEIQQVARLAENAEVASSTMILDGSDSSEAALLQLASGATWMHLATHGFFAESKTDPEGWGFQSLSRQSVVGFDPRLLTGIVLSGANDPHRAELEDGILTAAEIERLDLSKTDLVVLSACETALGEGRTGEGVMGLQRSLHRAGCKHVIASLWKVDDQATASLMKEFYRQLWEEKTTPAEALRSAQQKLSHSQLKNGSIFRGDPLFHSESPIPSQNVTRRLAPRYWAAFCISNN